MKNPFATLSKFELSLWLTSLIIVSVSFITVPQKDYLTLAASLIGVTALIFVAKGLVFGQLLTVLFSLFYGIISFHFRYYGEMITYLLMSTPIAIFSVISWLRHPYKSTSEVEVAPMSLKKWLILFAITGIVTVSFYYILTALDTANIIFSTISVATSFLACSLTFLRSPFYALAYGANDTAYLPMIMCFVMFLANDMYGYISWQRMKSRQSEKTDRA